MTTVIGGTILVKTEVDGDLARWRFEMSGPFMPRYAELHFHKAAGNWQRRLVALWGYRRLTQVGKKLTKRILDLKSVSGIHLTDSYLEVEAQSVFEWEKLQPQVISILRNLYQVDGVEMITS